MANDGERTRPVGRRRRRPLLVAVWLLFLFLLVEGAARIGHRALFGSFSIEPRSTVVEAADPGGIGRDPTAVVPHPFLGYALSPAQAVNWILPVNAHGLRDDGAFVRRRSPDRLLVGITGGSVALQSSLHGADILREELATIPEYEGRRVELVRFCIGGYKQPQQLAGLSWMLALGGELDVLINLDGFNEVALPRHENVEAGVHPLFPRSWGRLMSGVPDRGGQMLLGRLAYARDRRDRWQSQFSGPIASRLASVQLPWRLIDRGYQRDEASATRAMAATHDDAGPAASLMALPAELGGDAMLPAVAESWRRCSLAMHALCEAHGIRYFHFMQPNQYDAGAKPIGAEERLRAIVDGHPYAADVPPGYALLREEAPALWRAGVRFFDLSRIFVDDETPRYADNCCHLDEEGNRILTAAMGASIRECAAVDATELVAIAWDADGLSVTDPGWVHVPPVLGRFADGVTRDVTHAAFGTRFESADPGVVEVRADGRVRPRGAGTTSIDAHLRGLRAELRVVSSVALSGIRVEPNEVRLDDPSSPVTLRVLAIVGDREIDVTSAPETTLRSTNEQVVTVEARGGLSARGRGACSIEVRYDRFLQSIEVRSTIDGFASFGEAIAGHRDRAPALAIAPRGASAGERGVTFVASDVRPGAPGFFLYADRAAALRLRDGDDDPVGPAVSKLPMVTTASGVATISFSGGLLDRFAGKVVFVRAVFRDEDAPGGFSASRPARFVLAP